MLNPEITIMSLSGKQIVEALTLQNVVQFLHKLGVEELQVQEKKGVIICPTICHNPLNSNASMKLYWYHDKKAFYCYTECHEWMSIFELYQRYMAINYYPVDYFAAEDFIRQFISTDEIFLTKERPKKYDEITDYTYDAQAPIYKPINPNVLSCFSHYYHPAWIKDGIGKEAMDKFGILFSYGQNKVIIPHRDYNGQLIGIRARSFNTEDLEAKRKYMPAMIGNTIYGHPLHFNLYGLYEHQETIKKEHIVVIAEAEKSVLLDETYHPNRGICVACCGNKINKYHINLLVNQFQVQEIVIALDKDFDINSPEGIALQKSIRDIGKQYGNYASFSYIWDYKNLLDLKDSPYDKGKDTFEYLFRTRIRIR